MMTINKYLLPLVTSLSMTLCKTLNDTMIETNDNNDDWYLFGTDIQSIGYTISITSCIIWIIILLMIISACSDSGRRSTDNDDGDCGYVIGTVLIAFFVFIPVYLNYLLFGDYLEEDNIYIKSSKYLIIAYDTICLIYISLTCCKCICFPRKRTYYFEKESKECETLTCGFVIVALIMDLFIPLIISALLICSDHNESSDNKNIDKEITNNTRSKSTHIKTLMTLYLISVMVVTTIIIIKKRIMKSQRLADKENQEIDNNNVIIDLSES